MFNGLFSEELASLLVKIPYKVSFIVDINH